MEHPLTDTSRRPRARAVLLAVLVAVMGVAVAGSGTVAAQDGDRGGDPFPEVGADRIDVTLSTRSVAPGGEISFTGTGFVNDCEQGQTVTVKLNDVDILGTAVARDDGSVAGSVVVPQAAATLGYERYWLRFLTGTGATGCDGSDMPIGSLFREITLEAAGADTTTTSAAAADTTTIVVDNGSPREATTTTTRVTGAGSLPENGFDSWAAALPVLVLGGVGVLLLVVQRRMARS